MNKRNIIKIIKSNIVLSIATVLAIITCFIVPIDKEYLGYFNKDTLACLFCMLVVVAGLKSTYVFEIISEKLISKFHTTRGVIRALVFGTFFFDMIVANDMSLITFLPLTYIVLHTTKNDKYLAYTFILQTIAANMGGMITPYGNPQNLYLYSFFNIDTIEFFSILLPQFLLTATLLFVCTCFVKKMPLVLEAKTEEKLNRPLFLMYAVLFVLTIATIFRFIPYIITTLLVILVVLIKDRKTFKKVDYGLILTFCVFFVFSGNIARIDEVKLLIFDLLYNNTLLAGIVSCQFISNVPTAILLSQFTNNYSELLISVNIGSLGILISSLASLITLKEFLKHQPKKFKEYLLLFTIVNTIFLIILIISIYIV